MKASKSFHRRWRGQRITAILSRDGASCSLCPRALDRHVKDPLSADYVTFDHITPRSLGGLDTVTNVRLAHRRCNNLRGNDPVMPEDEERTRKPASAAPPTTSPTVSSCCADGHAAQAKCGEVFTSTTSLAFSMAARSQHESECAKCQTRAAPPTTKETT